MLCRTIILLRRDKAGIAGGGPLNNLVVFMYILMFIYFGLLLLKYLHLYSPDGFSFHSPTMGFIFFGKVFSDSF